MSLNLPPLCEDFEVSCRVLARLLAEKDDENFRRLLLEDFVTKVQIVRPEARSYYTWLVMQSLVGSDLRTLMKQFSPPVDKRKRVDVAIVTVIEAELLAAKLALGIDIAKREDLRSDGIRYWETKLEQGEGELNVALTMVGQARNLPCALHCTRVFDVYDVELCVLVGIAGGVKDKVSVGDVVAATEMVLDYEGQRLEEDGPQKRWTPYPIRGAIKRDIGHFNPARGDWRSQFALALKRLAAVEPLPNMPEHWKPDYHQGIILAGEKLFADGSLPKLRREYHDKVRAAEMEGSGFASACDEYGVPWLVFRGISDYGDRDKPFFQEWQTTAALSAATCAMDFLKRDYRRVNDLKF